MNAPVQRDVLIVDDDAATRVLLQTILSRTGLSVVPVADGQLALKALEEYAFEVIILDLVMPRLDGSDFLDHLRRTNPSMLPHVIILSAAPEPVISAVRSQPVWCTLRKPVDINDIVREVLDCLLQERQPRTERSPSV